MPRSRKDYLPARVLDRCLRWWNRQQSVKGLEAYISELEISVGAGHPSVKSERRALERAIGRRDRLKPPEGFENFDEAIEHMKRTKQWGP